MSSADGPHRLVRLIGVYDAEGTLRGEVAYWIGARLGRAHCSLCDITHGLARERRQWKSCRAALPVAFDTYHLDDQPELVREVTGGLAPVVVAHTTGPALVLLGPEQLADCEGSPDRLVAAVEAAMDRLGVHWPEA
jgi:hypothetical protein